MLQVSVYGKSRLGQDLFLGEVLVPLREVENTAANHSHDVRRYTLGRRSAKEKVSGEISLECSWRVTPLDVVTLKVCHPCYRPRVLQGLQQLSSMQFRLQAFDSDGQPSSLMPHSCREAFA